MFDKHLEIEKPPKPTRRDIIQAMLARGDKFVPCWISNNDETPHRERCWWEYTDLRTGQPIGQPITELPE